MLISNNVLNLYTAVRITSFSKSLSQVSDFSIKKLALEQCDIILKNRILKLHLPKLCCNFSKLNALLCLKHIRIY